VKAAGNCTGHTAGTVGRFSLLVYMCRRGTADYYCIMILPTGKFFWQQIEGTRNE
jgi:hypothetical protein